MNENIIYVNGFDINDIISRLEKVKERARILDISLVKHNRSFLDNELQDRVKDAKSNLLFHNRVLTDYNWIIDANIEYLKYVSEQFFDAEELLTYRPDENSLLNKYFGTFSEINTPFIKLQNLYSDIKEFELGSLSDYINLGKKTFEFLDTTCDWCGDLMGGKLEFSSYCNYLFNGVSIAYDNFFVEEVEWSRAIMETVIETAFEVLTKKGLSILIGSVAAAVLTACLGPLGLSASMILVPAVGNAIGDVVGEAVYAQADLLYKEYYAEKFGQEPENISEQVSDWILGEDDNIRK